MQLISYLKCTIFNNLKCQYIAKWKNELNNTTPCDVYGHLRARFYKGKVFVLQCVKHKGLKQLDNLKTVWLLLVYN